MISTISGNTITDSLYDGIELITSSSNTITGSVVSGSGDYGLYLSSSDGNTIYGNTFIDNNGAGTSYNTEHAQSYDLGVNTWTYGGQGNEWSDWSSENPYPHEGSAAANDVLNTLDIGDTLPVILAIAVVVVAIVVAFVLLRREEERGSEPVRPATTPSPGAGGQHRVTASNIGNGTQALGPRRPPGRAGHRGHSGDGIIHGMAAAGLERALWGQGISVGSGRAPARYGRTISTAKRPSSSKRPSTWRSIWKATM